MWIFEGMDFRVSVNHLNLYAKILWISVHFLKERKLLMWCPEMANDFSKSHPSVNSTDLLCLYCWSDPLWNTMSSRQRRQKSLLSRSLYFTHLMSKIYCMSGGDRCMGKNKARAGSPGDHFCFTWIGRKYSPRVPRLCALRIGSTAPWKNVACCAMAIFQGGSQRQRRCP